VTQEAWCDCTRHKEALCIPCKECLMGKCKACYDCGKYLQREHYEDHVRRARIIDECILQFGMVVDV
jgi:hypothetical protein